MKPFGSKRKARVIKVDDTDEQENATEALTKEAEPNGKPPPGFWEALRKARC